MWTKCRFLLCKEQGGNGRVDPNVTALFLSIVSALAEWIHWQQANASGCLDWTDWTATERLLILYLLRMGGWKGPSLSQQILTVPMLPQWKTVWGHPIVYCLNLPLFFTMSSQCQYSDLEAEHKQNWMWPWTTILSLKLRLTQFTWDAWPSLAHLFLFITYFNARFDDITAWFLQWPRGWS